MSFITYFSHFTIIEHFVLRFQEDTEGFNFFTLETSQVKTIEGCEPTTYL